MTSPDPQRIPPFPYVRPVLPTRPTPAPPLLPPSSAAGLSEGTRRVRYMPRSYGQHPNTGEQHVRAPSPQYPDFEKNYINVLNLLVDLTLTCRPGFHRGEFTCIEVVEPDSEDVTSALLFYLTPRVDVNALQVYLNAYQLWLVSTATSSAYSAVYGSLYGSNWENAKGGGIAAIYDAQAAALNANTVVQNPFGFLVTQITAYAAMVEAQVFAALQLVTSTAAEAQRQVNALKAGTIDPAVNALGGQVLGVVASATAAAESLRQQAVAAAENAVATVTFYVGVAQAEIAARQAQAEALVDAAVRDASAAAANAYATAMQVATDAIEDATVLVGSTLAEVVRLLEVARSQLADRPLYYGALSTPITVQNVTDVIVIPPGGLTVTAD